MGMRNIFAYTTSSHRIYSKESDCPLSNLQQRVGLIQDYPIPKQDVRIFGKARKSIRTNSKLASECCIYFLTLR